MCPVHEPTRGPTDDEVERIGRQDCHEPSAGRPQQPGTGWKPLDVEMTPPHQQPPKRAQSGCCDQRRDPGPRDQLPSALPAGSATNDEVVGVGCAAARALPGRRREPLLRWGDACGLGVAGRGEEPDEGARSAGTYAWVSEKASDAAAAFAPVRGTVTATPATSDTPR